MQAENVVQAKNLTSSLEAICAQIVNTSDSTVLGSAPFAAQITRSAVVIPVFLEDGVLHVRMTKRSDELRSFAGKTVFPGGQIESMETAETAALREYCEEVGGVISKENLLTTLSPLYIETPSQKYYEITPCLVVIDPLSPYAINLSEVSEVIDIPISSTNPSTKDLRVRLEGATAVIFDTLLQAKAAVTNAIEQRSANPLEGEQIRVLITSGGTRVPIDTARVLTNESEGTTGALIAEQALINGHFVHYLCAKGAKTPFQESLTLNPKKSFASEIERVSTAGKKIFPLMEQGNIERIKYFDEYQKKLLEACASAETDVVVLAMAASDYGPEKTEGKISSDLDQFLLPLKPLPKVISLVKSERPDIFLVGFKLLVNQPPDVLVDRAYANMLRDHQDLAVANVGANSMKPTDLLTYIVTGERGIIPVERNRLHQELTRIIEQRFSRRHFKTNLQKLDTLPLPQEIVDTFVENCRTLAKLAIFNPYLEGRREEFGFLAQRTEKGTLITARGSSKSQAEIDDLALVTKTNLSELTLDVVSTKNKASLNASIADLIFEFRPEIQYIVHAHISLPEAVRVARESSPSTAEDWERIEHFVRSGETVIEQPHHGVFILMKSLEELPAILERNSIYRENAAHYDHAYHRFLFSNRIIDIFSEQVNKDAPVLDLCSGTGEVTRQLLLKGFSDIILCDKSVAMTKVAREKLATVIPDKSFLVASIEELPFVNQFEGIIIRQAINYLSPEQFEQGLRRIHTALTPDGILCFNSFLSEHLAEGAVHSRREEVNNTILKTSEGNLLKDRKVYHGQRTEMFDSFTGDYHLVYDLNSFWAHSREEFEAAAQRAGFSQVNVVQEGKSLYFTCKK